MYKAPGIVTVDNLKVLVTTITLALCNTLGQERVFRHIYIYTYIYTHIYVCIYTYKIGV